jgi:predicted SAM-dependent methyltransferase
MDSSVAARQDTVPVKLEIGAGEKPHPDYEVHTDVLRLDHTEVICRLDALPFVDASITMLRANHVLEHQSWELIEPTLREWARVLKPGAPVEIGVPDARHVAGQWVRGELTTEEANYWLLGGHSDREAHRGIDSRGVPRWIWNAHHTLFDRRSLRRALQGSGFVDISIRRYSVRNLRCSCRRA